MEPFTRITAIAVPFDEANVDTNQLCPTRFNKVPRGERFWSVMLHDRRFNPDESEKPEFIFNQEPYRKAGIIVAGRNFGVGSSRETAVFGLVYFGIRCVIAPSLGDIFTNNAYKNGLLPIVLPAEAVSDLMHQLQAGRGAEITVDLPSQAVIAPNGTNYTFDIKPLRKRCLSLGLDEIALTKTYGAKIDSFEADYKRTYDWLDTGA
jgi:3-isopropylmalate/(R)-2-methylmalate dehydratase small subunit